MNCPHCGTELRQGASFCLCGQRLGAPPAKPSSTRRPSKPTTQDAQAEVLARLELRRTTDSAPPLAPASEDVPRTDSRTAPATKADRPAEIWRRLLAKVIDSSVLALLLAIGFQALGEERALDYLSMFAQVESVEEINFDNAALPTVALTFLLFWLPLWILSAACIAVLAGTPGKWLMGFKQVRTDGRNLGFRHALLREVLVYVIGLGFGLPIWGILTLIASRAYFIYFGVTPWDHLLGVRLVRT